MYHLQPSGKFVIGGPQVSAKRREAYIYEDMGGVWEGRGRCVCVCVDVCVCACVRACVRACVHDLNKKTVVCACMFLYSRCVNICAQLSVCGVLCERVQNNVLCVSAEYICILHRW